MIRKADTILDSRELRERHAGPKSPDQWKDYRSAKECALSWLAETDPFQIPQDLLDALATHDDFDEILEWEAETECLVPFDDYGGPAGIEVPISAQKGTRLMDSRKLVKWLVRIGVGILAVLLLVFAEGVERELTEASAGGGETALLALSLVIDLLAALLVFIVFFRWGRTRKVYSPSDGLDAAEQGKRLSYLFILGGGIVAASSFLLLFMLEGAEPNVRSVIEQRIGIGDLGLLILLGCAAIVIGIGLRQGSHWGRTAALWSGFVAFGGFPLGTFLALYTWWFTASPAATDAYRPTHPTRDTNTMT